LYPSLAFGLLAPSPLLLLNDHPAIILQYCISLVEYATLTHSVTAAAVT